MIVPKLSVLTTCYNREKYIGECIDSILKSSFEDFELIIVDDNSKDNSWNIIKQYAAKDNRIKPYRNESNLGDYPNRNKAASLAVGEYLKYVDADDAIGHHFLQILVDSMDRFPEVGLGLFGGKIWYEPEFLDSKSAIQQFYSGEHNAFNRSPLMAIIRRSSFELVGGFSGRQHSGDFELWHLLTAQSGLVLMPSLAWVRTHPDQQSQANRTDPRINFRYLWLSLDLVTSYLAPHPLAINPTIVRDKKRHIARTVLYGFKRYGFRGARAMKNETNWSWATIFKEALR